MNKERILVIEDENDQLENICFVLKQDGYETIDADDGRHGLEMARVYSPDLIICDINMPGLNGYEILEELRKNPKTAQIPFIFLTVFGRSDEVDMELRLGVQDYITKPFYFKDLLARVRRVLDEKK
ncbi:MAG: response regulator [Candidatus Aminicenantes bacterium]|nr:response regulator [Candidatus Aminicenantes bacterium]